MQGEEKRLSDKSLHSPASPSAVPDNMKCNILKAQMDAAFRVGVQVAKEDGAMSDHSLQEHDGSDEDDLPIALSMISGESSTEKTASQTFPSYEGPAASEAKGTKSLGQPLSKQRLSKWIADPVHTADDLAGMPPPVKLTGHSTRDLATSWALFQIVE
ncbi:UNVERIFIED_CONTAM: hypothetical protein FKN15_061667 [Acipenser sinensis]